MGGDPVTVPSPYARPPQRSAGGSPGARRLQILLGLVPLVSFGFLAFVPFLVIALMRQRARDWAVFAGYVIAVLAMMIFVAVASADPWEAIAGCLMFVVAGVGTAHSLVALRPSAMASVAARPWAAQVGARQVGAGQMAARQPGFVQPGFVQPGFVPPSQQAVLHAAKARIHQRAEARKLALDNPALARDLKIGRPDLRRNYDDGGLVDVNHVGADVLVGCLSLSPNDANAIVAARGQLGRFTSCAEVSTYANLQPACLDNVTDLIIFG
jgi:hypothetical protein